VKGKDYYLPCVGRLEYASEGNGIVKPTGSAVIWKSTQGKVWNGLP